MLKLRVHNPTTPDLTCIIWSHSTRGIIALNNVIILNWWMAITFFLACLLHFLSRLIIPPVLITVFHLKYHFPTLILIFIPISMMLLTHGTNLIIPLYPLLLFLSSKSCLTVHNLSLRLAFNSLINVYYFVVSLVGYTVGYLAYVLLLLYPMSLWT